MLRRDHIRYGHVQDLRLGVACYPLRFRIGIDVAAGAVRQEEAHRGVLKVAFQGLLRLDPLGNVVIHGDDDVFLQSEDPVLVPVAVLLVGVLRRGEEPRLPGLPYPSENLDQTVFIDGGPEVPQAFPHHLIQGHPLVGECVFIKVLNDVVAAGSAGRIHPVNAYTA